MSDLLRTTPVTRQSIQPRDPSGESAPDQGLVWPPSDSELETYIFPLLPRDEKPACVSGSIAGRQADAGQSTEPEGSREASPELVWPPPASELDSGPVWLDSVPVVAQTEVSDPVVTPQAALPQTAASEVWSHESALVPVDPVVVLARTGTPEHLVTPEAEVAPAEPLVTPPDSVVTRHTPPPVLLLSDVLCSNVEFQWHEAVAIVRQLADQLTHGLSFEPIGSIPGVDGIELEPTGRLRARLDPVGTVPLVRGLGYLLHILLADTGAPVRLRLIVSQAVSEVPTFPSVERLTWELAGFERPRRLETLKQLYERTADVRRTRPVPAACGPDIHAASRPASAGTFAHATGQADERTMRRPPLSWPALALALAAGAACGVLLFGAVIARSSGREAAPTRQAVTESTTRELTSGVPDTSQKRPDAAPADPVRPAAHGDISPSRSRGRPQNDETVRHDEAVRPSMKSGAATYEIAPPPIGEPARLGPAGAQRSSQREVPQKVVREYRRARALFDQRDYAKAADGFLEVVKLLDDAEPTGVLAELRSMASEYSVLSRATLSAMTAGPVYSSGDAGVTEPVALRLYLPEPAPETPSSRLGVLMLVVNGDGGVESVRLQSSSNRYHDRFWVSAAKTWRFRPALKDGLPVRFLKRIVITEPPLSDPQ